MIRIIPPAIKPAISAVESSSETVLVVEVYAELKVIDVLV